MIGIVFASCAHFSMYGQSELFEYLGDFKMFDIEKWFEKCDIKMRLIFTVVHENVHEWLRLKHPSSRT